MGIQVCANQGAWVIIGPTPGGHSCFIGICSLAKSLENVLLMNNKPECM